MLRALKLAPLPSKCLKLKQKYHSSCFLEFWMKCESRRKHILGNTLYYPKNTYFLILLKIITICMLLVMYSSFKIYLNKDGDILFLKKYLKNLYLKKY